MVTQEKQNTVEKAVGTAKEEQPDLLEGEIWKLHEKSGYWVSNTGRVKGKTKKFLHSHVNKQGYLVVGLSYDQNQKSIFLHRLVADTFIGIKKGEVVNHLNGNKADSRLINLKCCSQKENMIHCFGSELAKVLVGEDRYNSKLKEFEVKEIYKLIKSGVLLKDIAKIYSVGKCCISNIKRGKTWSHLHKDSGICESDFKKIKRHKLNKHQIKECFRLKANGYSCVEISNKLSFNYQSVVNLLRKPIKWHLDKLSGVLTVDFSKIKSENDEKWKLNKRGFYISNYGRVVGVRGRVLNLILNRHGYLVFTFRGKSLSVHRCVFETFNGEIPDGYVINHLNGIKNYNKIENLELSTPSENSLHAARSGLSKSNFGENAPNVIFTEKQIFEIYSLIKSGVKNKEIAVKFGVARGCISAIKRGLYWKRLWQSEGGISNIPNLIIKRKTINKEEIRAVKNDFSAGLSNKEISDKYEIPIYSIEAIRKKKYKKYL